MQKFILIVGALVLLVGGSVLWSKSLQSSDPDIISKSGVHWHPELEIYVNDVKQEISKNVGVGPSYAGTPTYDPNTKMTSMHTHEDVPKIHFEFPKIVRKEDTKLGTFFKIWGKDFMSFGTSVKMTVNGVESQDLENYEMKDKDKIILRFSK